MFLFSPAFKTETHKLIKLALPILFAQLALTGLGVVDTIMSGQVGTNDLAAIGLGSNIMLPVFIFTTGILLAITPLVSKANGNSETNKISLFLAQGLWLAVPLGIFSIIILLNLEWLLNLLELNPKVYQLTEDYLFYIAFGMPGIALYQALRFFWEGLELTLPTMWISFFALFLNIPLNALFIYGYGPIDGMGAAGCGVASAIVMWAMFAVALLYVFKNKGLSKFIHKRLFSSINWQNGVHPILSLGFPNSMALLFEVSLFSFIALFIAVLGTTVIAAHQIAISFTSIAFMIPLSLGMALTVRVGTAYGQNSREKLRAAIFTGFIWAFFIGIVLALGSLLLRHEIVSLYSFDPDVMLLASTILIYAAMYQVFDAIQVNAAGALRGLHDTKVTMWVTFFSYWCIGLGLGYVFTFTEWLAPAMGVEGFWLGIVIGLTLAAILLPLRLRQVYYANFK